MILYRYTRYVTTIAEDCVLEPWSPWSECSVSCDGGSQYRYREVETPAVDGGADCSPPYVEERICGEEKCPGEDNSGALSHVPCIVACMSE